MTVSHNPKTFARMEFKILFFMNDIWWGVTKNLIAPRTFRAMKACYLAMTNMFIFDARIDHTRAPVDTSAPSAGLKKKMQFQAEMKICVQRGSVSRPA